MKSFARRPRPDTQERRALPDNLRYISERLWRYNYVHKITLRYEGTVYVFQCYRRVAVFDLEGRVIATNLRTDWRISVNHAAEVAATAFVHVLQDNPDALKPDLRKRVLRTVRRGGHT